MAVDFRSITSAGEVGQSDGDQVECLGIPQEGKGFAGISSNPCEFRPLVHQQESIHYNCSRTDGHQWDRVGGQETWDDKITTREDKLVG